MKKPPEVKKEDVIGLLDLFKHGKTFGSLITIPEEVSEKLPTLKKLIETSLKDEDMFLQQAAVILQPFIEQALILARKYDCVVANPPYMGLKGMNQSLKDHANQSCLEGKSDLYAMFIERAFGWLRKQGISSKYNSISSLTSFISMVTMQSWMFLSSFETFRKNLLKKHTIITMAHLGSRAFGEIAGEDGSNNLFCV